MKHLVSRKGNSPLRKSITHRAISIRMFPALRTLEQDRVVSRSSRRSDDEIRTHELRYHTCARRQQANPAEEHTRIRRKADDLVPDSLGAPARAAASNAWSCRPMTWKLTRSPAIFGAETILRGQSIFPVTMRRTSRRFPVVRTPQSPWELEK